jgi:hypothetical protein
MLHRIWRTMLRMKKRQLEAETGLRFLDAGFLRAGFESCEDVAKVRGCGRWAIFGVRVRHVLGMVAMLAIGLTATGARYAQAQDKLGPGAAVTYANRFETYGGLNFMNFQAGQNLPTRMNLGGGEISGTYWWTGKLGVTLDYRGEAGTTPVFPVADVYGIHRPLVYMNMGMAGAQYRGAKNQFAAINYHAYGGIMYGVFDAGTAGAGPHPGVSAASNAAAVGLYSNGTGPIFAVGGSLDLNRSKNWAVRLSPDLILEHFGTETREFFAISGGIVYRIGKK